MGKGAAPAPLAPPAPAASESHAHATLAPPPPVRSLFGGAMQARLPARFQDLSEFREIPDNQEVLADGHVDQSIVVELLELKADVADSQAATWFFLDLCREQDAAEGQSEVESVSELEQKHVPHLDSNLGIFKACAVGRMLVSKSREGLEAGNLVRCYLAVLRLRSVGTDLLISLYDPLVISERSSSADALGAGPVSSSVSGGVPAKEVFETLLATLQINDWGLFGA